MRTINRRDMVLGVGAAAGLTTLRTADASSSPAKDTREPAARDVHRSIRLVGDAEQKFLARMGGSSAAAATLPSTARARPKRWAEGTSVVNRDGSGNIIAQGLEFVCDPRSVNALAVDGQPFVARRFCFSVSEVNWSPGFGLPVCDSFSPRYEYAPAAYYREAKWHQIVPMIGEQTYFTGCQASDVCEASEAAPIAFDVNDSDYEDNLGSYAVTIWSWS